jgi:hypothetical protein
MELHRLPWSSVMGLIGAGELVDAKTLTSLLFVQCLYRHH